MVEEKLIDHYGCNITTTEVPGQVSILSFQDTADKILHEKWHTDRKRKEVDERLRIIEASAAIIREDIRSKIYQHDKYYSLSDMTTTDEDLVPETLRCLIAGIVKSKNVDSKVVNLRRQSIEYSINSACRPRSFVSPLMLSAGLYINRKFGMRQLIEILSSFGFTERYKEIQRYEYCLIADSDNQTTDNVTQYIQYIFDNADFNIKTLNGLGTFHSMGGVKCVTSRSIPVTLHQVPRLTDILSAPGVAAKAEFSIQWYKKPAASCLKKVSAIDIIAVL